MSQSPPVDLGIPGIENPTPVGSGGFASVYRAFQPAFERTVAVKVLTAGHLDDRARERFDAECRAMGSLSEHPNIVTLHDAGFTATGHPYLVMAYMAGGSLADRVARVGALGWEEAIELTGPVADALATAHRSGILHRDIKPANVLLSRYGTVHLGDFGIARIARLSEEQGKGLAATMAYAPPEVLLGGDPAPAADLWSLGVTLYEAITGVLPHPARPNEEQIAWVRRIADDPLPDLRRYLVPDEVCDLVQSLMEKDPRDRPASAVAVLTEFREISRRHGLGHGGAEPERPRSRSSAPPAPPPDPAPSTEIRLGPARPARPADVTPPPYAGHPATPPPGGVAGWWPTHRVPLTGLSAWERPDPALPPTAVLDPWLDVQVAEWVGVWARVVCANAWEAWVDGRYLEATR